jgi:hypothetical protein
LTVFATTGLAAPLSDQVLCAFSPSESNKVAAIGAAAGVGGGTAATTAAVVAATGLTAVTHSSGLLILTGASGYVAGTIGVPAAAFATAVAAAPVILAVSLVVGAGVVTVELVFASRSHPKLVRQIEAAASEFDGRFRRAAKAASEAAQGVRKTVTPLADKTAVELRKLSVDSMRYAYRTSAEAWAWITR